MNYLYRLYAMTLSGRVEYILFRVAYICDSIDKANAKWKMQRTK